MIKKAVIDIDNTLWQFCDVLYEGLREVNSALPSPDSWINWDFWMHFCSEDEFMSVIHRIQMTQDNDSHLPYKEAENFLKTLKDHNFHIVIASHRTPESLVQTKRWLLKHNLIFDELHLSSDKTVLFNETCHVVVDDSPFVLDNAAEKGIFATGLKFPWNMNHGNNGYKLFNNLDSVLKHILETIKTPH